MEAIDEIKTSTNLNANSLDINTDEFDDFITGKNEFFENYLTQRYDRDEEIISTVAILLTINYLNKLKTQLEQGVVIRSEYNNFDTNTLLLFDDTIKELLKRGAVLL